jgi:hypothetical protein
MKFHTSYFTLQTFSDGVYRLELELDFLPQFASSRQLRTPLASFTNDIAAFTHQVAAFVTGLDTSF